MEILLKKKAIIEMLEKYYFDKFGIKRKASITATKGFGSYGMSDIEETLIDIKLVGSIMLLGKEQDTVITIRTDEMIDIIQYYIESEGYEFTGYTIDKGLNEVTEGYGVSEHTDKVPYFNGIEVGVKIKNKIKEKNYEN